MTINNSHHSLPRGPLVGEEPSTVTALRDDNIIGAVFAATFEIAVLSERVARLTEAVEALGGQLPNPTDPIDINERAAFDKDITGPVMRRVLAELFRSGDAWTKVDPRVTEYFDQPDKL